MNTSHLAALRTQAICVLAGVLALAGPAGAGEWQREMAETQIRLDRLEQQCQWLEHENASLRRQMEQDRRGLAFEAGEGEAGVTFSGHRFLAEENPPEAEKKEDQVTWHEVGKQTEYRPEWRNGLVLETADKAFRLHVGGRFHMDGGWWIADQDLQFGPGGVGPLEDGANYRRARIRVNGLIYETVEWIMEYGFENRTPQFFDVYGELPHLPIGAVRLGHFREPFSMDALTGGNFLALMERSLIHDAFVPFRNLGVQLYDTAFDEQVLWAVGMFRAQSDNFNAASAGDGDYAWTGRLTWNPWYEAEGRYALHLGGAASYRSVPSLPDPGLSLLTPDRRFRFATRPEFRVNAPAFADTGPIHAEHMSLVGAEAGLGLGPLLFQGEYVAAQVYDAAIPPGAANFADLFFHGFYVQASWFLTGEHRPYLRRQGVFGQLQPHENFFWVRDEVRGGALFGRGAWEAAVRYSHLNLNDRGIEGGVLSDVTLGLNWYLNPNSRFMANVILIDRNAAPGAADGQAAALGVRYQVDF
jgi:phosphate-selective porin OprO and OprP